MQRPLTRFLTALSLTALSGCSAAPPQGEPDLRSIYAVAAKQHDEFRNPVIVIPGILGSKLTTPSGRVVWGAFTGRYADPETPNGAREFAHPLARSGGLNAVEHTVQAAGVLDTLKIDLLGIPISLHAYIEILKTLGIGGFRDESLSSIDYGADHFTCFQFDYDWRRDNVHNAARLERFIRAKKTYVEAEFKRRYGRTRSIKFDIVAHSMGGLVARYFARYGSSDLPLDGRPARPTWPARDLVERVILIGTPNAGSVSAVREVVEGVHLAPFLPAYAPALVGSLPSVYQLFPRTRHRAILDERGEPIDLFRIAEWDRRGWGLLDPNQSEVLEHLLPDVADAAQRRAIAKHHLARCLARAKAFQAALDLPATPPAGLDLYIVAGDALPTDAVLTTGPDSKLRVSARAPGDTTVLRTSALLDERVGRKTYEPHLISPIAWRQVQFVFSDHLGMTRDPHFIDHVLYLLLEDPRQRHASSAETHDPDRSDEARPASRPAKRSR